METYPMVTAIQIKTYTVDEFLELDLPEGKTYELINGVIVPIAEPSGKYENLRSELWLALKSETKRANLGLLIHPQPVLVLGRKDTRKPDLIVIKREDWNRQTQIEAVLREPPSIAIEIVSTNWEDDYRNKPLWYAAFGVQELWIIDPLFHLDRYPGRRNPKILQPTISVGQLVNSDSILTEKEYRFESFTESDRIKSQFFPELNLTVAEIIAFGEGI
jgi:Uma2 family endonuclease